MSAAILALNCGSSSIKFAVIAGDSRLLAGAVDGIDRAPHVRARVGDTPVERKLPEGQSYVALLQDLVGWVERQVGDRPLAAVGHRVVHGGRDFTAPVRVTPAALEAIAALESLAPLHQPHNVTAIRAVAAYRPALPQVACFDTAFHATLPAVASRYALPRAFEDAGVRRYGFHGLSFEYIADALGRTAPALAKGRVIVAHLGNGASLCALADRRSVDTTMGLTPLDGLVMGTRCGAIDPGVPLYLQRRHGMTAEDVERLLYRESGLLGVSGVSSDMRDLLASDERHAREAVDLFIYRVAREAGGLVASLGGLDGLVFTGGIGEHEPRIRAAVCERLGWLGVTLDPAANVRGDPRLSAVTSRVEVRLVPTDEEGMIVRHTGRVLDLSAPG